MRIHQLFFPLVSEANEHVLARTLQPLAMILDEPQETVDVDIVFEVDSQYVSHIRPLGRLSVSPEWPVVTFKIKRIETRETSPQYYPRSQSWPQKRWPKTSS